MPMIDLDAGSQPPQGVAGPSSISFFVGNPPRQMLIFSGVALANWDSQSDLDFAEARVKLGASSTEHFQYTSSVGLGSIYNEDSDFTFAADQAWVVADSQTGELTLHVTLAVQGEPSVLNRFTYHVQVLSDPIVASISGTIRWHEAFGDPTSAVLDGASPMFRVVAGITVELPPVGGFRQFRWDEHASGFTTAVPVKAGGMWAVPYLINHVPLGTQFEVRPDPSAALAGPPPGYIGTPSFAPPVRIVELTPSWPAATGVDFEMSFNEEPR
jgi:hypothetical protein